jgi:hypothetical protein
MGGGIDKEIANKLYNSMTKIKISDNIQTGFFMNIYTNDKKNFLLTCGQNISEKQIQNKIDIDLFYGNDDKEHKTIKLDRKNRYIKTFEDITVIEIIQEDGIPEDKYLFPDLNYLNGYGKYNKNKIYFSGYTENYTKRNAFSGEITSINGFKFMHKSENLRSSGSPICTYENQYLYVIGIYKSEELNGIFIGKILDDLKKENININNNFYNNKIIKKKFFFFDENKKEYIDFNKNILREAFNQNEKNYFDALKNLNKFLLDINDDDIFGILEIINNFDHYNNDYNKMLKDFLGIQGFISKINRIIRKDNNEINEKFYYFIGGFLNILEKSEVKINNEVQIFRGDRMDYKEILNYQKKINKIIFFKGFCSASKSLEIATPYSNVYGNSEAYSVITTINYKIKRDWVPYCFDISEFEKFENQKTVLFAPDTCFKIKGVDIDEQHKKAKILLDSVGIKRDRNLKEVKDIIYNENENFFNVV